MLEQKTIQLQDHEIVIQQLSGSQSLIYTMWIGKIALGSVKGIEAPDLSKFRNWKVNIGDLIGGILDRVDEEVTAKKLKQLTMDSIIEVKNGEGKKQNKDSWFESFFSGNISDFMELLMEILTFNSGGLEDFIGKKTTGFSGKSGENQTTESIK